MHALERLHHLHDATLAARARRDAGQPVDQVAMRAALADAEACALEAPAHAAPALDAPLALAAGALRLLYYRVTVLAARPLIDSLGSKTLPEFVPDLTIRDEADAARWRRAISAVCGQDAAQIDALEHDLLAHEIAALSQRQRLIAALDAHLHLATQGQDAAHALLCALFSGCPLTAAEVDLIATSTALYLCLPYTSTRWTTRGAEQDEDDALMSLLRRITRPQQATMAYFPAFAPVRRHEIDPALLRVLADHTGMDEEAVRATLPTLITILPRDEVDKYIVHDAWGHQWQAHLFTFEEAYQRVARMAAPQLDDALCDALCAILHNAPDAHARWDAALERRVQQNLTDSLTGLFAEVLADAVEYKFLVLNPARRADLLSSSFFKELPTKLDLTLADLPLYFTFATRGLRKLDDPRHAPALHARLRAACPDADEAHLSDALGVAARWTCAALDDPARWAPAPSPDEATSPNTFERVALDFARLHIALNQLYAAQEAAPRAHPLLDRAHDLIIFTIASAFEQHPATALAALPALIAQLPTLLDALFDALDGT